MSSSTIDLDRLLRRLHLPTVRRLYAELEARAEDEGMSYRDYLAILIAEEVAHRGETRVRRSVHQARFPFLATIEEFDFTFQSSVRLSLLGSALGPELISEGRTMVLCGPSGTGKTHLAIAIAYRAIQNGGTAVFREANHLIEELSQATGRGTLREAIEPYLHTDVLVIDELGYLTYPQDAANVLFQVVNQRYLQKRAIVVTTNKPLDKWASVLHDKDLAEAIIDRVLARGRLIELRGSSYRTRHLKTSKDDGVPSLDQSAKVSGISVPKFPEPTGLPRNDILSLANPGRPVSQGTYDRVFIEDAFLSRLRKVQFVHLASLKETLEKRWEDFHFDRCIIESELTRRLHALTIFEEQIQAGSWPSLLLVVPMSPLSLLNLGLSFTSTHHLLITIRRRLAESGSRTRASEEEDLTPRRVIDHGMSVPGRGVAQAVAIKAPLSLSVGSRVLPSRRWRWRSRCAGWRRG